MVWLYFLLVVLVDLASFCYPVLKLTTCHFPCQSIEGNPLSVQIYYGDVGILCKTANPHGRRLKGLTPVKSCISTSVSFTKFYKEGILLYFTVVGHKVFGSKGKYIYQLSFQSPNRIYTVTVQYLSDKQVMQLQFSFMNFLSTKQMTSHISCLLSFFLHFMNSNKFFTLHFSQR